MKCRLCHEAFNAKDRRLKFLPCGHAFCLRCVQGLEPKKCPVDNVEFEAAELLDHSTGVRLATGPTEAARLRFLVEALLERLQSSMDTGLSPSVARLAEALADPNSKSSLTVRLACRRALQRLDELQWQQRPAVWAERANEVCDHEACEDEECDDDWCDELTLDVWVSDITSWYGQCLNLEGAAWSFQVDPSCQRRKTLLTDGRLTPVCLINGRPLTQVRALVGLDCSTTPDWGLTALLLQVAPHLEGLELFDASQRHLDLAVAMPRLESLDVHCTFDAPLPVVAYPKMALQWLRCGVYPLAAALALVRANAETLEELHLVAASKEPYGCPDLAAELSRCGLKKLHTLILQRQTAYDEICRHDQESCEAQKTELWSVLVASGLAPSLFCSVCDPDV